MCQTTSRKPPSCRISVSSARKTALYRVMVMLYLPAPTGPGNEKQVNRVRAPVVRPLPHLKIYALASRRIGQARHCGARSLPQDLVVVPDARQEQTVLAQFGQYVLGGQKELIIGLRPYAGGAIQYRKRLTTHLCAYQPVQHLVLPADFAPPIWIDEVVAVGQVIVESHCGVDNCPLSACSNPRVAASTTLTLTALRERNAGESNRHGLTQGRKPVLKTGRATRPSHSGVFLRRVF
jgi:hypothetical protein